MSLRPDESLETGDTSKGLDGLDAEGLIDLRPDKIGLLFRDPREWAPGSTRGRPLSPTGRFALVACGALLAIFVLSGLRGQFFGGAANLTSTEKERYWTNMWEGGHLPFRTRSAFTAVTLYFLIPTTLAIVSSRLQH